MNRFSKSMRWLLKVVMLTLVGSQAMTSAMASMRDGPFAGLTPVSQATLDGMRGGFQRDPAGPFLSFGIERNVFIDAKLVGSTMLNISDVANHSSNTLNTFMLIQNGPSNSFPHDVSALPPFMTVIQNSLDNQTIQSHTVLNATVEALTWAHSFHLGAALSQANIEAIRY